MPLRTLLSLLVCSALSTPALAAAPRTFAEAKRIGWQLYARQSVEFYCGCRFQGNRVDLKSCGYVPRKNPQRAARIEWEHIVPAWLIGHQRQCWQRGGRQYCSRHDAVYQRAEADLHNLVRALARSTAIAATSPMAGYPRRPASTAPAPWWWTSRPRWRCRASGCAG